MMAQVTAVDNNQQRYDALLARVERPIVFFNQPRAEEQLGLVYVATAAQQQGFDVRVVDEPALTIAKMLDIVSKYKVKVVGFYVDHENIFATYSMMRALKRALPEVKLVTGGPQSKEWHERILRDSPCDIAVRGEGEIVFANILSHYIYNEMSLANILGITWRDGADIRANAPSEPIDLDRFPIPNRAINPWRRRGSGSEGIVTGRGCPFRCAFCYEGRPEARYRPRDLDNVMEEVEHLVRDRGARYLVVLDDVFLLNPKRAIEFARRLTSLKKRLKSELIWFCEARADIIVKRPDMVNACVESGLTRVQIGVETGDPDVMEKYNKSLDVEETLEAAAICHRADVLSLIGNFIIGGADETWETLDTSIKFAEKLLDAAPGRIDINSTIFTPYPGTPMYNMPEKFGIELLDRDCVTGPGDNYPFHNAKGMGKWEIVHAREKFFQAIDEKMRTMLPTIPVALAERHFRAAQSFALRTRWFDFFCRHFNWYNYVGLPMSNPDVRRLSELSGEEILDVKPLRTVYLGATHDGKFVINAGHQRIELSEDASALLELCAGKLSLREILGRLSLACREMTTARARDLLQLFDENRLVIFSAI
jgi:radical SAM superfamily enzyme YgiQ (UPF0313 family)